MAKKFDVTKWAKTTKSTFSSRCGTCLHAEAAQAIREIMTLVASGESEVFNSQIYRMLREQFNYSLSQTSLHRHMQKCEADLWKQIHEPKTQKAHQS